MDPLKISRALEKESVYVDEAALVNACKFGPVLKTTIKIKFEEGIVGNQKYENIENQAKGMPEEAKI